MNAAMSDQSAESQQVFESIVRHSCLDLFADFGVPLEAVEADGAPVAEFLICSVIGFTGRHVRGSLVVATTERFLERSHASLEAPQPRDWIGEISNQLLGRIKRHLLARGVEIYLNLPAVLRGEHLAPLPRQKLKPMRFRSPHGEIGVWIEVEAGNGFGLAADGASDAGPPSGEPVIF